jgi:hypothetical protein
LRILREIEEPFQKGQPVRLAESEPHSVRRNRFGHNARIVLYLAQRLSDDLGDGLRVLAIAEQVSRYPRWPIDQQPAQSNPLTRR